MLKILVTQPEYFDKESMRILESIGEVKARRFTRKELENEIRDADIVVVRVDTKLDRSMLEKAQKLKIIGSATTGLDHIDIDYARKRGIKVISLHGTHTISTAELTLALILSLCRNVPWAYESMEEGKWVRYEFMGTQLNGKVMGVVGLGRIGMQVARYGRALGMRVLYYDPYIDSRQFKKVSLSELLKRADVLTVHAALTKGTYNLIGYRELNKMKKGAFLVNTARGQIVNNVALVKALRNGTIKGAALDVFPNEPVQSQRDKIVSYAKNNKNLIITPHIGASTREAIHSAGVEIALGIKEEMKKDYNP